MTKMDTFGTIKSKVVKQLTESYISKNKSDIKEIINIIKKDKEFKDLFLFYEDIENKFFEDEDTAKLYVEQVSIMLKDKSKLVENTCNALSLKLENVIIEENKVYDALDQLLDIDSLKNIDKKVVSKKKIVEVITTKKKKQEIEESVEFTDNEKLLHTLLSNNFNAYYDVALNEEEKTELKTILSLSEEELTTKVTEIKETIYNKINGLIVESKDDVLLKKLNEVKKQVSDTEISKYSFYSLKNLLEDFD